MAHHIEDSAQGDRPMTIRTTTKTVAFRSAFQLPGWDAPWPAGAYEVSTDEEQLEASFVAFLRIETRILLRRGAETMHVAIAPQDLEDALARDRSA
jgi:hypothetical protein